MSLKPYWVKHPFQLRLAAAVMLVGSPVLLAYLVAWAAWEDRKSIFGVYRELWGYLVRGGKNG